MFSDNGPRRISVIGNSDPFLSTVFENFMQAVTPSTPKTTMGNLDKFVYELPLS
jgi:hypothetical protein